MADVPDDVMKIIRKKAAADYPYDYVMQKDAVREQIQAWLKLDRICGLSPLEVFQRMTRDEEWEWPADYETQHIPDEVMRIIRRKAAEDCPDDFVMQKDLIEEQIYAFLKLRALAPEIPEDVFQRIYQKAKEEYPEDFDMQLDTIEDQVRAYKDLEAGRF